MGKMELRDRVMQSIQDFNLFSNVFMKVVFRDRMACQHVLRILIGDPNLIVVDVRTEYEISKVRSHDSKLDVLAEDREGKLYNLELQRDKYLDHAKRVRFYNSMVDSEMLDKGKSYDALPELSTYYISENDIWKKKQTCYPLEKILPAMEEPYQDGTNITYVNAEIDDHSEVAQLMKYFKTADPYDNSQGDLSKRVHFLKCEEEGIQIMCKVTDELIEIGKEIGEESSSRRIVKRMAEKGMKLADIVDFTGVSMEIVKDWLKGPGLVGVYEGS